MFEPGGSFSAVPVLETERLRMRCHRAEDFGHCLALWSNPEVTRFIGGRPFTQEEVWTRLLRYVGHWTLLRYGYWVIEERTTGAFVGEVGFADFRRTIEPSLERKPEIGWVLAPAMQGRGYATEAARAAVAWADAHLAAASTVCLISPDNRPSLRVAERCGFRERMRTTYRDSPIVLLGREGPASA